MFLSFVTVGDKNPFFFMLFNGWPKMFTLILGGELLTLSLNGFVLVVEDFVNGVVFDLNYFKSLSCRCHRCSRDVNGLLNIFSREIPHKVEGFEEVKLRNNRSFLALVLLLESRKINLEDFIHVLI
jgi:hypothetical protein